MNKKYLFALVMALLCACQPNGSTDKKELSTDRSVTFFSEKNPVTIGAYYYPEQWPEKDWENDLKKMSDLGFEFTHFGEFSWSTMEPEEGKYNFEWLDKSIDLAAKYNLKVILCTPSPTPPAWLTEKHPEILMVNENGITMQHGSRQHASWSSLLYRKYVEKICTELAKRYGQDKRVWGWQLDNEPSHYGYPYDFCDAAQRNFKTWLAEKYQHIDSLNARWGNSFWSQTYNSFDQIRIPNPKELVQPANPHALLDFQEFTNHERGKFLRNQAQILRAHVMPSQFITTNYLMQLPHLDPWVNQTDLDFASYTNYPVNSYSETDAGPLGFRLGSGRDLAITHDFYQSVNGITGIMELQPGQVNWGRYNAQPQPGAVRMWIWHAFGLGSKFICTYRFRQPLFGNEQYHQGILQTDGITLSRGGEEYAKAIQEITQVEKHYTPTAPKPRVAILWDHRSMMDMTNFPHNQNWNATSNMYRYYELVKTLGIGVDFISSDQIPDPKCHPVLILPSISLINSTMLNNWSNYVAQGGQLLIAPRTGQKNRDGFWWEEKLQQKMLPLTGARTEYYDHLPLGRNGVIKMNTRQYEWNSWGEILGTPLDSSVTILATHESEFYQGKNAVLKRKLNKGNVFYIGITSNTFEMEKEILLQACTEAKMSMTILPPFVYMEQRGNLTLVVNYSSKPFPISVPDSATVILGAKTIHPSEVLIWKQ